MAIFKRNTLQRHSDIQAAFMQDDPLSAGKNIAGTNVRRTLDGVSPTYQQVEDYIVTMLEEYNLLETELFISEYESAYGIPGDIFETIEGLTLEERRNQVLIIIRANGAQIDQDFIDIAALLGFTITIEHFEANNIYLPPYDVPFAIGPDYEIETYTWIVRGENVQPFVPPYDVPFTPTTGTIILNRLFDLMKPAHTKICYLNTGVKKSFPCPPSACELFTTQDMAQIINSFGENFEFPLDLEPTEQFKEFTCNGCQGYIIRGIPSLDASDIEFTLHSTGLPSDISSVNLAAYQDLNNEVTLVDSKIGAVALDALIFEGTLGAEYYFVVTGFTSGDEGGPINVGALQVAGVLSCTLITVKPVAPFAFYLATFNVRLNTGDAVPKTYAMGAFISANYLLNCQIATREAFVSDPDTRLASIQIIAGYHDHGGQVPGVCNFYVFDPDGVLRVSALSVPYTTTPFTAIDSTFTTGTLIGSWLVAVTGADASVTSTATNVNIILRD